MMATNSSSSQKGNKRTTPPKRGKIKGQIFESLTKTVISMVSKAGEVLKKYRGQNGENSSSGGAISSSSATTPQLSNYGSDG